MLLCSLHLDDFNFFVFGSFCGMSACCADTGDNLARDTSGTKGLKDLHIYKVREPQISDQGLDAYNDITISETDVTVYEVSMKGSFAIFMLCLWVIWLVF